MPDDSFQFGDRSSKDDIERGHSFAPKFDDNGLITVITTDEDTNEVLMVAYMNDEALARTLETGEAVYWSRSREVLWHKGATSGHTQQVSEIRTDCDQDALLLKVRQQGSGCCHVGYRSCFYRRIANGEEFQQAGGGTIPLIFTDDPTYDPSEVYPQ